MVNSKSRVLLFTSSPLEGSEGADKQTAAMLSGAIPDTDFTWFTRWPERGPRRLRAGHPVPIVSRDGIPHIGERLQVAAAGAVMARRADLVHAVMTLGTGYPMLSRLWPVFFPSRRVIHTVPGIVDPQLLGRARPIGVTVALSQVTADALHDAGFGDVRVIPPAISMTSWPRRPRRAGLPRVLFAGHHDPGGGAAEAIEAASVAQRAGARFRLDLAMRLRPGQDGNALAARLARLGLSEGISDLTLHAHVADMPSLLAATDVLLFTPRSLAGKADVPITVLEALATGRPAITSDLPQFEGLGDGVVRVPVGDTRRAGQVLAELLGMPRLWRAAADRGFEVVRDRFSPERFAAEYRSLYAELLA
jgi:glycosyltransferase involved in cell wall biosynthesis